MVNSAFILCLVIRIRCPVTERQQIFPVGYDNLCQVMLLPEEFLHEVIDFMFFMVIKV